MKTTFRRRMSTLGKAALAVTVAGLALPGFAACVQDQYGNQYTYTIDTLHKSVTGTAVMAQCSGDSWPLVGNVSGTDPARPHLALVFANESGNASCSFGPFMLKGKYPKFAWYYPTGFGGQESRYVACGSEAAPSASGQGVKR